MNLINEIISIYLPNNYSIHTRKRYHPCVIVSRDDDPREVASSRGSITRGTLRVTLEIITIKQRSACSTREWKIINVFFYHRGHADRSLSTNKESFEGGKKKKGRWKALIHDRTARTRLVVSYNTIYKSYGDTYTRIYWPCYFSIGLETSWTDLTYRYESRIRSSRDYFSNLYTMFLRITDNWRLLFSWMRIFLFFFFLKIDRLTEIKRILSWILIGV